jgi:hypothetical protein
VELDGVVEYKSLPSGLHNVKEDLVYFVHDKYAGLSAFIHEPAPEADRNALMLAVGVLVPLSYGRLGRSWRHADNLQKLAIDLTKDTENHSAVENYWEKHRQEDLVNIPESPTAPPQSSRYRSAPRPLANSHARNRSMSDAPVVPSMEQSLGPHHPALSLLSLMHLFGPLIFPIYRAALTRKRILLVTQAPVEQSCNFGE